MSTAELLTQGLGLMVAGMVTVFIFLSVLVLAMMGQTAFFKKYAHLFPEPVAAPAKAKRPAATDRSAIAAAIAAAFARSR